MHQSLKHCLTAHSQLILPAYQFVQLHIQVIVFELKPNPNLLEYYQIYVLNKEKDNLFKISFFVLQLFAK